MLRSSLSSRRVVGVALALSVGTGIGVGAYTLGNAAGADTTVFPTVTSTPAAADRSGGTTSTPSNTPSTAPDGPAASPLTLEEAQAIALEVAPGRVVEWDEDQEPTGLRYDITVLHDDGTSTDVEVDTATGQITSIDHDNDQY